MGKEQQLGSRVLQHDDSAEYEDAVCDNEALNGCDNVEPQVHEHGEYDDYGKLVDDGDDNKQEPNLAKLLQKLMAQSVVDKSEVLVLAELAIEDS